MGLAFTDKIGRDWLRGLLKTSEVEVTFVKVGGDKRKMRCTLKEDVIVPHEKKTDREKEINEEVLAVWDVEKNSWRSFRFDSIIKIEFPA